MSILALSAIAQEGIAYIRVGSDFSIKFTERTLALCSDETFFLRENDSTFTFNQPLDYTDLAQVVKVKMKVDFEEVTAAVGYENRFGIRISETEGAIIYDGEEQEAFVFSGWQVAKELDANRKYSLKLFEYGNGFVNSTPPEMSKSKVKEWCKSIEWCPDNEVSVYCAKMIVRVTILYQGQIKNYYLNFDRRVGEC